MEFAGLAEQLGICCHTVGNLYRRVIFLAMDQFSSPGKLELVVHEVNSHGFYAADFDHVAPEAANREEQIYIIYLIAILTNLKVSFNHKINTCIFEKYNNA